MKAMPVNRVVILAIFVLFALSACGVFEVGIERTATPDDSRLTPYIQPTEVILPTQPPTPFPGHLKPGQAVKIIKITMLNINSGWAVGQVETDLNDHILFTTDGGRTWRDATPPEALVNASSQGMGATTFFGPDGDAWVTYAGQSPSVPMPDRLVIWHTTDNGSTWQKAGEIGLIGVQAEFLIPSELGFLNQQQGWLLAHVGAGMSHDYVLAFLTTDGGKNWSRVLDSEKNPELMACYKTGFAFSSATHGWLVGNCPGLLDHLFFYTTTDGGQSWQQADLFAPVGQPLDMFSGNTMGCGIPDLVYLTARSTILTLRCQNYSNGQNMAWLYTGQSGSPVGLEAHILPLVFGDVFFLNSEEGWMVGSNLDDPAANGEIYHTTDGGLTWTLVIGTAWQGTPNFVDSNAGWVVARSADKQALVFTSDGGRLWDEINPIISR